MKDFLLEFLYAVIAAALTVATPYLLALVSKKISEVKAKTDSSTSQAILGEVDAAIQSAVLYTSQTFVDALKKRNEFSEVKQKEALNIAFEKTMLSLSETAKEFLENTYDDVSSWLIVKIEEAVKLNK